MPTLAILTNARAADQRSMIGYGDMVLEAARSSGAQVMEWRGVSAFARLPLKGRARKVALNLDRFVLTPLKLLGRKADTVHVIDPGNCVYLPLIRHRRSIVTVHDLIPYLAAQGRLDGFRPTANGQRLMARILAQLHRVDRIICVSQATQRDLLEMTGIDPARVSVIPNAVFQPMVSAQPEACAALRARIGLPPEAPLVLHVGRNFYKNRPLVLRVFAEVLRDHPQARLVLVGALEPALVALVADLGIGASVTVLDHVAPEDMATLYTTASVLFFPSTYEGFGLPVLEAQMCGTPVVCSDAGSLPEVAGEGCVVVNTPEVACFASEIAGILSHGEVPRDGSPSKSTGIMCKDVWADLHLSVYRGIGRS